CRGCQSWARNFPRGQCIRCRRAGQPVRDGLCRGCTIHLASARPDHDDGATQLRLGEPFGTSLRTPAGKFGYRPKQPRPRPESDAMAIVKATPGTAARRVLRFLDDHGLLERDLTAKDTARAALERRLNELPTTMRAEIRRWVSALRGEGRRRHHVMPFRTIDL